ncbi:stearoyl-CoA 9-desaturase [Cryptotrichosporon argae]
MAALPPVQPGYSKEALAQTLPSTEDKLDPATTRPSASRPVSQPDGLDKLVGVKAITPTDQPSDANIPDNYVTHTIQNMNYLPPITASNLLSNIQWISFFALTIPPAIAIWGLMTHEVQRKTWIWAVVYYYITGLGITAGYHRLWAHRAYNASLPLQYALAMAGAGAVQGSIKWWSRGHRAHHRYTDTKLDPYSAHEGFWWSHVGWMLVKPRGKIGVADISDLTRNKVVRWQHNHYLTLLVGMGLVLPTVVAGLGWGDWWGGFFYAGAARLVFVHHSTFCVNSLAHWLGETPFDNKHTPRDHFITALCTIGEGYHNFHHQFPQDFRNAIKWHQYDPTKWFIWTMSQLGLASHLKMFPDNEIKKGQYTMKLQRLADESAHLKWPKSSNDLPVISWEDFQAEAKERSLIAIHGFIHDCSSFVDDHPGGAHLIKRAIGTDATTAFFGGVYDHSNAAHNLLAMMRVGVLDGGMEVEHLKTRLRASSVSSVDSGASSPVSDSGSASSVDIRSIASADIKPAPKWQPAAMQASSWTLAVPPSEKLRIVPAEPVIRPGLVSTASELSRVNSFDSVPAPVAAA